MNYPIQQTKPNLELTFVHTTRKPYYQTVLQLIRNGDIGREKVARQFYKNKKLANGLNKVLVKIHPIEGHDFWHVFNLTIVSFFKTVLRNKDFTITRNLHSYLFMIARNIWLQELKNKKPHLPLDDFKNRIEDTSLSAPLLIEQNELKESLNDLLSNLKQKYIDVLQLWAVGFSMKEIQEKLGLSSIESTRKRKFDALKKLNFYLEEHPQFQNQLRSFLR